MQPESSSMAAASCQPLVKRYRAYFTKAEIDELEVRQRGKLSSARYERNRQTACSFIDSVGVRIGFPRRVIATAQTLYHRFHLFFPVKDFKYTEVCLTTLYVSSKLHDTLKKPREIILASYALRYPHLLKGRLTIDPASVDQSMLERDRKRVLGIERLVLETICFNFRVGDRSAFKLVVKLSKALGLSKAYTHLAWQVTADAYHTLSPLRHTPQSICIAAIFVVSLLLKGSETPAKGVAAESDVAEEKLKSEIQLVNTRLSKPGPWEAALGVTVAQIESITHDLLDLYIIAGTHPVADPSTSLRSSPLSPSDVHKDPITGLSSATDGTAAPQNTTNFPLPLQWNLQSLTQLKIALREGHIAAPSEATPKPMPQPTDGREDDSQFAITSDVRDGRVAIAEGLGRNDSTVRFLAA